MQVEAVNHYPCILGPIIFTLYCLRFIVISKIKQDQTPESKSPELCFCSGAPNAPPVSWQLLSVWANWFSQLAGRSQAQLDCKIRLQERPWLRVGWNSFNLLLNKNVRKWYRQEQKHRAGVQRGNPHSR